MAARFLSDAQLERLRGFPEIGQDELVRFFTLTPDDIAFVVSRRGRSAVNLLGLAVQLCTLRWLGFVPAEVSRAPSVAVARLAATLEVDPGLLTGYGERDRTRRDHLRLAAGHLGWSSAGGDAELMQDLERFLLDRAMEHDSPTLLFHLACEFLASNKVVRPGLVVLMELVSSARAAAVELTYQKVQPVLTDDLRAELDGSVVYDRALGMSTLAWLGRPAVEATSASARQQLNKLLSLRQMGADRIDLSMLGGERRRHLATIGKRSKSQALARREPHQRYPILLNCVVQLAVDRLDEVIALFDQVISARESRAKAKVDEALAQRARAGEDRQRLLNQVLHVLTDPAIPDEQVGGLLRDQIGRQELQNVHDE